MLYTGADQNDAPYNSQGVPLSQLRKLQLSDDDRALMDKVKSQGMFVSQTMKIGLVGGKNLKNQTTTLL